MLDYWDWLGSRWDNMWNSFNFRNGLEIRDPRDSEPFSIIPLNIRFFERKTLDNFRNLLGDHFARVESSGDQNLSMFILHFDVFFFHF